MTEVFTFWSILIDGGGSMPFPITSASQFFPDGSIGLTEVQMDGKDLGQELPKPLGKHALTDNQMEPTAGTEASPPFEFKMITVTGKSFQEAANYDALANNSANMAQKQSYGTVTLKQWASVSAGPNGMVNTVKFIMYKPVLINVKTCSTLFPDAVEFTAEIYWGGNAELHRTSLVGDKKMPYNTIRCADSHKMPILSMAG